MMHDLFDGSDADLIEEARAAFEADAKKYGFDLMRYRCAAPEPWSQYANEATGHRWGGWLAAIAAMGAPSNATKLTGRGTGQMAVMRFGF